MRPSKPCSTSCCVSLPRNELSAAAPTIATLSGERRGRRSGISSRRSNYSFVIPGRRAAASPKSIFQRPVFMDSRPRPQGDPGMTGLSQPEAAGDDAAQYLAGAALDRQLRRDQGGVVQGLLEAVVVSVRVGVA